MKRFPIIKHYAIWIIGGFIAIGIAAYLFFTNINPSIQFTGGVEVKTDAKVSLEETQKALLPKLKEIGYENPKIAVSNSDNVSTILLQLNVENQEHVQKLSTAVHEYVGTKGKVLEESVIGASVGDYIRSSAVKAIIIAIIFIAVYMMFSFAGVREVVSPLILAIITIVTLLFDISIPSGAYGILMHVNHTVQIDLVFVASILTVMGYSINDTIIIFDRVRENIKLHNQAVKAKKMTYKQIFEDSLWQTMRRSLMTSTSTFLMVLFMRIFGTGIIKLFAYTIGVGIIAGTFSSIFIAAPLAYFFVKNTKGE